MHGIDRGHAGIAKLRLHGRLSVDGGDHLIVARQKLIRHVKAKRTVNLELFFAEELVTGRFVRKAVIASRIVADVVVFIARQR